VGDNGFVPDAEPTPVVRVPATHQLPSSRTDMRLIHISVAPPVYGKGRATFWPAWATTVSHPTRTHTGGTRPGHASASQLADRHTADRIISVAPRAYGKGRATFWTGVGDNGFVPDPNPHRWYASRPRISIPARAPTCG